MFTDGGLVRGARLSAGRGLRPDRAPATPSRAASSGYLAGAPGAGRGRAAPRGDHGQHAGVVLRGGLQPRPPAAADPRRDRRALPAVQAAHAVRGAVSLSAGAWWSRPRCPIRWASPSGSPWLLPSLNALPAYLTMTQRLRSGDRRGAVVAMLAWALTMAVVRCPGLLAVADAARRDRAERSRLPRRDVRLDRDRHRPRRQRAAVPAPAPAAPRDLRRDSARERQRRRRS